jgi:geranylgeranyl diphosphate synthase type I
VEAPPWLPGIAADIDARLGALLDQAVERWAGVDKSLAEPLTELRRLVLAGGKRLRPAFCFWAFIGGGGHPGDPRVLDAAAALELQHTSALIHDDVIDDTSRRHGGETLHRAMSARHAGWHGRGEPRRFGEGAAILSGNLAAAFADRLLAGTPATALRVFAELREEVNAGQYLDLAGAARGDIDPAGALRICEYKSAKYTVERPLHLGAALAGPEVLDRLAGPLSAFGMPLGTAFQLRDDLLDAFGDPDRTGKAVGSDLREGKATYLVALARQVTSGADARFLGERYGAPDLTDAEIPRLQEILTASGARGATEALIRELQAEAEAAAAALPVTDDARAALGELAAFVAGRDR